MVSAISSSSSTSSASVILSVTGSGVCISSVAVVTFAFADFSFSSFSSKPSLTACSNSVNIAPVCCNTCWRTSSSLFSRFSFFLRSHSARISSIFICPVICFSMLSASGITRLICPSDSCDNTFASSFGGSTGVTGAGVAVISWSSSVGLRSCAFACTVAVSGVFWVFGFCISSASGSCNSCIPCVSGYDPSGSCTAASCTSDISGTTSGCLVTGVSSGRISSVSTSGTCDKSPISPVSPKNTSVPSICSVCGFGSSSSSGISG